jgi:LysM repeat protein
MNLIRITFLLLALAATGCVTSRQSAIDARLESQERKLDRLERMVEELALKANDGIYVVRPGDTAAKIARTFGTTPEQLRALNPEFGLPHLHVGQRLKVR